MSTLRLFTITAADQKASKASYLQSGKPPQDLAPPPVSFGDTIRALVALYRRCEHDGATELARRTQRALVELIGPQKHLKNDDDGEAVMHAAEKTLRGLGKT